MKMKYIFPTLALIVTALFVPALASAATFPVDARGLHLGEAPPLEYHITYEESQGITTAGALGILFAPFGYLPLFESTILPYRYFGDYPLYFSAGHFAFTVHLKNVGKRTYRNLLLVAVQEHLNTAGGAGVAFPSDTTRTWYVKEVKPGEEMSFSGNMTLPFSGTSGLDQTHLQIIHWDGNGGDMTNIGGGRVILDDPQAGLWCPVASH